MAQPELEEFRRRIRALQEHPVLSPHLGDEEVHLGALSLEDVGELLREEPGRYFLMAAARLNRTSLKEAMRGPEAQVVSPRLRRAFAVRSRLPVRERWDRITSSAVTLRGADLRRMTRGAIEELFRDRLEEEGIPLYMAPPIRRVPGLLITQRKPDGVYPDPKEGTAPRVYLEVKNVRRVSDDIQKRLYELAEAALEMKVIYGNLRLVGLGMTTTQDVAGNPELRARVREQTSASLPIVVGLFLCPKDEAERYREGAEAFIDRLFFQEEIEECLEFLRRVVE